MEKREREREVASKKERGGSTRGERKSFAAKGEGRGLLRPTESGEVLQGRPFIGGGGGEQAILPGWHFLSPSLLGHQILQNWRQRLKCRCCL